MVTNGAQAAGAASARRAKTSVQDDALAVYNTYLALGAPRSHKLLHGLAARHVYWTRRLVWFALGWVGFNGVG
jgi:hypothetical protein